MGEFSLLITYHQYQFLKGQVYIQKFTHFPLFIVSYLNIPSILVYMKSYIISQVISI